MARLTASSTREDERHHTEDEGERGHQNRPKPDTRGFDRRLGNAQTTMSKLFGKFNNENPILRRETDQHHQTDLTIDVVDQSASPLSEKRAHDRERHGQQDDER